MKNRNENQKAYMKICQQLLFLLICLTPLIFVSARGVTAATINRDPLGKGSLPAHLFSDGAVCLVDSKKPSVCGTPLVKIPRMVTKAHSATFYGVFDVDGDGSPEVFFDYWSPSNSKDDDNVVLLVFKKIRGKYRQFMRLKAQSYGYHPGAWFLNEAPHAKAVFMTRYGGSSGSGLFYLNLKKKSLELISGPVFLEDHPEFLDLDGDGTAEIFMPGRGRDRTSQPGAAILHWRENGYEMWWPNWEGIPGVIYATLADVDGDGRKEILAVLDPEEVDFDKCIDGKTLCPRQLSVWKVTNEGIVELSTTKLPDAKYLREPQFGRVPPFSSAIELDYSQTIGCTLLDGKITCREEE
jgi:hypothetical protein